MTRVSSKKSKAKSPNLQIASLSQIFGLNRKAAKPFPGGRENRVAHRRHNHGQCGLADSRRRFLAHHDMGLPIRRLVT
jgi:hypothetical protein